MGTSDVAAIAETDKVYDLRPLTVYEQACKINFVERDEKMTGYVDTTVEKCVRDVTAMEMNIVNQIKRRRILKDRRFSQIPKITANTTKLRADLLNSFAFIYFDGKQDARNEIQASLGKRMRFSDIDLAPREGLEKLGKKAVVSKAEFTRMAARERMRSWTIAGVVENDLLNTSRSLLVRGIDEGWTLPEYAKAFRDANVQYTGTDYGVAAKKGEAIKPWHLETIIRTNFSTVYNDSRWVMMNHPDVIEFVPAYQYSAILDTRTRPSHAAMDGKIYPRDDPIWLRWKLPAGYSCRCYLVPVTSNHPFTVSKPTNLQPDPGFGMAA